MVPLKKHENALYLVCSMFVYYVYVYVCMMYIIGVQPRGRSIRNMIPDGD